ncbi:MAG TPA: hypothetical protein VGS80_25970 [Ktedonobacterales bacterium]|nr:hypothetical protein [Ktedonobacterales bacterium]
MLESFATVVPTVRGVRRGTLRPAAHARYGLLLVENQGTPGAVLARIYDELELYLQAADITQLRLSLQRSSHAASVIEVLAGISTRRSLGLDRILVMASADSASASTESAAAARDSFLEAVVAHASTAPDMVQTIESLIATVRQVADSVVGVALLVTQPPAHRPTLRLLSSEEDSEDQRVPLATAARQDTPTAPHRLVMPLPTGKLEATPALTRLYTWATKVVQAEIQAPAESAFACRPSVRADAGWEEAAHWLDQHWLAIVDAFSRRAPERAQRVRAYFRCADGGTVDASMQAARHAWRYLDAQAQQEWLSACSQTFTFMAERAGILARRQIDLRAHG